MGRKAPEKKPKSEKVYNLKVSDIERMKRDAIEQAVSLAWRMMLGFPVLALLDEFDFNRDQLEQFVEGVLKKYDSYEQGYITIQDIDQALRDEVGIQLEETMKTHRLF